MVGAGWLPPIPQERTNPSAGLLVPNQPVQAVAVDHLAGVGARGPRLPVVHDPPPLGQLLEPLPQGGPVGGAQELEHEPPLGKRAAFCRPGRPP